MGKSKVSIWAFLKFGTKENLLNLMNNGELFINTISAFQEMKDKYRGDIFEGASTVTPGGKIEKLVYTNSLGQSINFQENGLSVEYLIGRPNWKNKPTHMYCLYMLKDRSYKKDEQVIDERNLQFGNYALAINNPGEFVERISSEFNNRRFKWKADFVTYVEIDSDGRKYDLFKKPQLYDYQNEYRFLISTEEKRAIKVHLGSLKKISVLLGAEEIRSLRMIDDDEENSV